jgi:hypothetical protein
MQLHTLKILLFPLALNILNDAREKSEFLIDFTFKFCILKTKPRKIIEKSLGKTILKLLKKTKHKKTYDHIHENSYPIYEKT